MSKLNSAYNQTFPFLNNLFFSHVWQIYSENLKTEVKLALIHSNSAKESHT